MDLIIKLKISKYNLKFRKEIKFSENVKNKEILEIV